MKDKKIKVNISISPKIKELAQDKIDMFAGNFSAYIAHLIIKDVEKQSIEYINESGVQITAPIKKTKITNKIKK